MNKTYTLILIFLFYIIAFWTGFLSALFLETTLNMYANLFVATTISTVVIYLISLFIKNTSLYDPYWSVQPIFLLFTYYFVYNETITLDINHLIVIIPLLFWSVRLTVNWGMEFTGLDYEDWRYKMIKSKLKNRALRELVVFIGIMYVPTLVVFFTVLPLFNSFMILGTNQLLFYIIGAVVILAGIFLELTADSQMQVFRQKKLDTNIDSGLWKYSRHPNYLGELLVWTGVFIATFNNFKVINVIGVIAVYLMFIAISIPMAEKRYLEKYPRYIDYKKRTSMLLFLPKRKKK